MLLALMSSVNEYEIVEVCLFFFDVSLYIKDIKYREHSNARISFIHKNSNSSQVIVIVGTHIDKLSGNYKAKVESYFAGKPYRSLLKRMAYINTTKNFR